MVQWPSITSHQSYCLLSIDDCSCLAIKSPASNTWFTCPMSIQIWVRPEPEKKKWISNICKMPVLMNCYSVEQYCHISFIIWTAVAVTDKMKKKTIKHFLFSFGWNYRVHRFRFRWMDDNRQFIVVFKVNIRTHKMLISSLFLSFVFAVDSFSGFNRFVW